MLLLERMDLGDLYEIEINKRKILTKVIAEIYLDEYYTVDEDFENEEQEKEYIEKISNGELTACYIRVRAFALDNEGDDSLSAVVVAKLEQVTHTIKEYSMIDNALNDLKTNILANIEALKPYMEIS